MQQQGKHEPLQESRGKNLLKQCVEILLWENNGIIAKWNLVPGMSRARDNLTTHITMQKKEKIQIISRSLPNNLSYIQLTYFYLLKSESGIN